MSQNKDSASSKEKSNSKKNSSSIDWYLIQIILHLVVYAAVGVIILYRDVAADLLYHALGVAGNIVKFIDPYNFMVSEMYYVRCATRALRPYSFLDDVAHYYSSKNAIKTIYYSLYCAQDFLLALVGAATFFKFSRKEIISAIQREVAVARCLVAIYFGVSYGDWIAVIGNACDALSKNGLIYMMSTGNALPSRVVAAFGGIASAQKLMELTKH